jgi:hypothetical protein
MEMEVQGQEGPQERQRRLPPPSRNRADTGWYLSYDSIESCSADCTGALLANDRFWLERVKKPCAQGKRE